MPQMNYLSLGSIQSLPVREALGLGLYRSSIPLLGNGHVISPVSGLPW